MVTATTDIDFTPVSAFAFREKQSVKRAARYFDHCQFIQGTYYTWFQFIKITVMTKSKRIINNYIQQKEEKKKKKKKKKREEKIK